MAQYKSFIGLLEESFKKYWELDSLTDYRGTTLQYKDVARRIEKLHILLEHAGVQRGDRVALCGRNSSNWGVTFMAVLTYGAVAVPILHDFKADNVHNIVNHSESKLLFVGSQIWENLNEEEMPALQGVVQLDDFSLLITRSEALTEARQRLNEFFGRKYPKYFHREQLSYRRDEPDELALINYTSGTTGFSKGVMVPYRALVGNVIFASHAFNMKPGEKVISMLPMSHMYGMAFEFIFQMISGVHIFFLTRVPSPKIILQAFAEVRPHLIIAVPLIIEKIIKKNVLPKLQTPTMRLLLKLPVVNEKIRSRVCQQIVEVFGGRFREVIVGGSAFNQEIDQFLTSIKFPVTVGYGTTECAPIISYAGWRDHKVGSCGYAAYGMEVKIDSSDPQNQAGEIICRGPNVMLGYYKNPQATAEAIEADGWYHTGDLAVMDADGHIFIRGRSKNMLLGSSGQNIYPEEIEDRINNMPYVSESLVIMKEQKLVALIYPDMEALAADGIPQERWIDEMEKNRIEVNKLIPAYEQISEVKLFSEEFEKTAKKSIKRYLYQE